MSTKSRTFNNRSEYLAATSARFSALISWTRELMGVDFNAAEKLVCRALQIRGGLIIGNHRPPLLADVLQQAALELARETDPSDDENEERNAVVEDVRQVLG